MALFRARIDWALQPGEDFRAGRYQRGHAVSFEHGPQLRGTAAPQVVGKWAEAGAVDPEQMLTASISACHMLSFLHLARLGGFTVVRYRDEAEGRLEKNVEGRLAVTRVALRPAIEWEGPPPDAAALDRLHHDAHEACFIAASVKAEIVIEPAAAAPGWSAAATP